MYDKIIMQHAIDKVKLRKQMSTTPLSKTLIQRYDMD